MSEPGEHEESDVPARVPVYVIAFTAVFVPLGALAMWLLATTIWQAAPEPPPVFEDESARDSSAPQLQREPPADMAELDRRYGERLGSTGWVDRDAGIVHMPVDRAMDLIVQRGLPGPESGPSPPPERDAASRQPGEGP